MNAIEFLNYLRDQQIPYQLFEHEPLFTVEQASEVYNQIKAHNTKNLFIRDEKKNYFLVTVEANKRVDLKALSKLIGKGGFSFGNEEKLQEFLGVKPGAVTPMGLVNDKEQQVTFVVDEDLMDGNLPIACHPLENDKTIAVAKEDFLRFLQLVNHLPQIINIPIRTV